MTAYAIIHRKNWPITGRSARLETFPTREEAEKAIQKLSYDTAGTLFYIKQSDMLILEVRGSRR